MSCTKAVVTAFKKVDGVTDAKAIMDPMTATVTYDPAKTNEEKLAKALEGTRYKITGKVEAKKEEEAKKATP